jgi:multiple sugar transport system substrate-binding protein
MTDGDAQPESIGRRQIIGGAGAFAGAAALARPRPAKAATTELRYLNVESDPASVAFLKQLAQDYETATGVRVVIETIVGTTLWTKVTTAIKTGRPYDIIDFAQPTQIVLMAQQDALVPLTEVFNEIGLADFNPLSMVKYKGDLWYFPLMYNFCVLYYRQDWLKDAGLAVPTTWTQFAAVAQAFTDRSKRRFGTSLPYSTGLTPWGNSGFLWAGGVKFYDDDWNVRIDTPDMKPKLARTLDFLAQINPNNVPGQFNMTLLNIRTNFLSGSAGIVPGSGSLIEDFKAKAPELADKFVIAPYPGPDGGKGSVVYGGKGLGIGKSENSKAAIDFLRWFVHSGKLIEFQLVLPMYSQPAQYSTYKNPKWLNNPTIQKFGQTMATMRSFLDPDTVNADAVQLQGSHITANQGMIVNSEVILHMYQNVLTKTMTVSEAIDDCAGQIRKFTKRDS